MNKDARLMIRDTMKMGRDAMTMSRDARKIIKPTDFGAARLPLQRSEASAWREREILNPKLWSKFPRHFLDSILARLPLWDTLIPSLWSTLPTHLVDVILSRLPVRSLFRFCTVCKVWDTLIRSKNFIEECVSSPCRAPWFFFFSRCLHKSYQSTNNTDLTKKQRGSSCERIAVSTYDSALNKWHKLPLCRPINRRKFFTTGYSLAADGGLVCYFSCDLNHFGSIVVSNPVTKSCRSLPSLPKQPRAITMLAMVVDRVTNTYKVVLVGHFGAGSAQFENKALVYDSRSESWTATGSIPGNGGKTIYLDKPIFSPGFLYAWNAGKRNKVLLTCNLEQGVWSELPAPLPVLVRFGELLQWQGRILTVGMRLGTPRKPMQFHSICIWELKAGSLTWEEVDQMPPELFEVFLDDKGYFQGGNRQALVLVPCQAGQFLFLFSYMSLDHCLGRCKWLVYDISNKKWQKSLSMSRADVFGKRNRVEGIAHEPRLNIMP